MQKLIITIFLFALIPALAQERVASVEIVGLEKTKKSFVELFINTKTGSRFDSTEIGSDVQALRNLQIFSEVDFRVIKQGDSTSVEYHCRENTTILPISNFGSIEGSIWFQLGAVDYNWLGRGHTLGGYYRYYDRHSFEVYLNTPYLFGASWGLKANLNKFSTTEPAYFSNGTSYYDVDRWTALVLGRYSIRRHYVVEAGGGYLYEKYIKNPEHQITISPGPARAEFDKYLAKVSFSVNRANYFWHYVFGFIDEVNVETIKTEGEASLFWKVENILRYYKRLGAAGNFALRLRTGIAANEDSPFAPFVLDSYLTVRGAGNRVARGTAEFTINLEYRHTFLQENWIALQGVGFSDFSSWRPGGADLSDLFTKENTVSFIGLGARIYLKQINHLILRADYGVSVTESDQNGIVIGLGQYF